MLSYTVLNMPSSAKTRASSQELFLHRLELLLMIFNDFTALLVRLAGAQRPVNNTDFLYNLFYVCSILNAYIVGNMHLGVVNLS